MEPGKVKKNKKHNKHIMYGNDSASTQSNPLDLEVVLDRVLAYLPGQYFLQSRLVCKHWNCVALSLFPKKFRFGAHRDGAVEYDLKKRTLERKLLSSIVLYKGTSVETNNYETEEGCSVSAYNYTEKCLQFDHVARYSETIREIKIHSDQEMDRIAFAANNGRLCNLQTLLYSGYQHIQQDSRLFEANSLPNVLKLKQFGVLLTANKKLEKLYHQAMLDATTNLKCFIRYRSQWDLDFSGCNNLTHLEISTDFEDDSTFRLFLTLNQVKATLEKLRFTRFFSPTYTMADWKKSHPETPFPVFPKLKSLQIQDSNQFQKNLPGLDFSVIFPKLERLSAVVRTEKSEDALISRYLETKPLSLILFETTCCERHYSFPKGSKSHSWINHIATCLVPQLPNLKRFRVSSRCIFAYPGSEREEEGKELLNLLCNLDLPHVIVGVKEKWHYLRKKTDVTTWWDILMFQGISSVSVCGRKGGVLEFQQEYNNSDDDDVNRKLRKRNEVAKRGYNDIDPEYDAALTSLFNGLVELSKKWNMITFKPILMTRERIEKVEQSIKQKNLPFQLLYAFNEESMIDIWLQVLSCYTRPSAKWE